MGTHSMVMDDAGRAVVTLSGVFGQGEASSLAQALSEGLDRSSEAMVLSLDGVEQGGVLFFQLLLALCRQAGQDGKRVVLAHPLSVELRRGAELLGISQKDLDAILHSEAV